MVGTKAWFFTQKEEDVTDWHEFEDKLIKTNPIWFVVQLEQGNSETAYVHYQGYVYYAAVKRMDWIKRRTYDTIHLEYRRGDHAQCKTYCSKDDTRISGPWYFGSDDEIPKGTGARSDLSELAKRVREGATDDILADESPTTFIRYHKGLNAYRFAINESHTGERQVIWLWGDSGTGKTHLAWSGRTSKELYPVASFVKSAVWFDGYRNQSSILIDNLTTDCPWTTLMKVLDKFPSFIPVKGAFVHSTWETVYVTSIMSPVDFAQVMCLNGIGTQQWELGRRLTKIVHCIRKEETMDQVWTEGTTYLTDSIL